MLCLCSCSSPNNDYLQAAKDATAPNTNFLFASNASLPGRLLFGNRWELKYLGLEFFAIFLYTLLYTMLYYWSKAFASILHPLQRIIITFIPYALIFYWAVIEGVEANWRMAVIFQGLFAFLFSLSTISIEYALKAWLPTKIKRIASIVWNTLTIFLIIIFLAVFIVEAYQIK